MSAPRKPWTPDDIARIFVEALKLHPDVTGAWVDYNERGNRQLTIRNLNNETDQYWTVLIDPEFEEE